jgi:hypothetical protein
MKSNFNITLCLLAITAVPCLSYNYDKHVELPEPVKKLLPRNPEILAADSADLNGDRENDFIVIIQHKDPGDGIDAGVKGERAQGRRLRELFIITVTHGHCSIAAKSGRAVLCSDCAAQDEDPFFGVRVGTKVFTILHKFNRESEEAWGITSKFVYSPCDKKWRLERFSGYEGLDLKPADFGPVNIEDFDVNYYMTNKKVEARPQSSAKSGYCSDEILFSESGTVLAIRPDGGRPRPVAGGRFFRQIERACWSPDHARIAFIRDNDLRIMNAAGNNDRRLVEDVCKSGTYHYASDYAAVSPRWSPDGNKIAVIALPKSNAGAPDGIYLVNIDSGTVKKIKQDVKDQTDYCGLCWSPDSKKLAYYSKSRLMLFDVQTGVETCINERHKTKPSYSTGIAWSQDGKKLITAALGAFVIMDTGGKIIKEIECVSSVGPLFWSKDEKYVLYFTPDCILKTPVEPGAKPSVFYRPSDGVICDMAW